MTGSRVHDLAIRLRIPAELEPSAAALKQTVERELIARVLDELERLVHAAVGHSAIVRIRRLALRWQLDLDELSAPAVVARLAGDVSRSILDDLSRASPPERLRPRSESIAVFVDEHHAAAAQLADAADGLPSLWAHARATTHEMWERVYNAGPAALASVVMWLGRMERLELAIGLAPEPALNALAAIDAAAPAVAIARARRAASASARAPVEVTRTAPPVHAPSGTLAGSDAAAAHASSSHASPGDRELSREASAPVVADHASSQVPSRDEPRDPDATPGAERVVPAERIDEDIAVQTSAAGLFYLVGRALEIDLAEQLWGAGLPEGDVLAHIGAALLGDARDPAWRWFGGVFDRMPASPSVPDWALAEVTDRVQHALGRRLVRFGVALTPAALGAQLDHLAGSLSPQLPAEPSLARLISRSAASLAYMTCARLGVAPSAAAVRAVLARPGHLVRTPTELRVIIPARHVDVEHRRAGLDHNPGHVPWLQRAVRIETAGAVEA